MTTTYLYSRLYGNYSGLTSSDENNRNSPSVNRFFDGQYNSFDRLGQPVFGPLQTDRPHVFKVEGFYDTPWGTGVGLYQFLESGTPQQTQMSEKGIPFYPVRPQQPGTHAGALPHRPAVPARAAAWRSSSHQHRLEHREPVRSRHGDAEFRDGLPRHLQRHRSGVLQRHVRSGGVAGGVAEDLSSGPEIPARRPVAGSTADAAAASLQLLNLALPAAGPSPGGRWRASPPPSKLKARVPQ